MCCPASAGAESGWRGSRGRDNPEADQRGSHAFTFGVLLAYQKLRAGLVHHGRLRTPFEVTRTARSNLVAPIDTRVERDDGMMLRLPRSVGVVVAWLRRPLLRVALDVSYDR